MAKPLINPAGRRGQTLVFVALVLPLALLPVAAYAIESTHLASVSAHLQEVTQQAAEDAAQQIDVGSLRAGEGMRIDPAPAEATVRAAIGAGAPGARVRSVSVGERVLTVVVEEQVPLQLSAFVGGSAVTVRARATARLTDGYDRPSSLEPLPTRIF